MRKKIWSKCHRCEGDGVLQRSFESYNSPTDDEPASFGRYLITCPDCKGKRGWLVDPKFMEVKS